MLHYMYNKNLGSGELQMRLRVEKALEVLREWHNSSKKIYGNPQFPPTYWLKMKTYGLVWHDRILNSRGIEHDKV